MIVFPIGSSSLLPLTVNHGSEPLLAAPPPPPAPNEPPVCAPPTPPPPLLPPFAEPRVPSLPAVGTPLLPLAPARPLPLAPATPLPADPPTTIGSRVEELHPAGPPLKTTSDASVESADLRTFRLMRLLGSLGEVSSSMRDNGSESLSNRGTAQREISSPQTPCAGSCKAQPRQSGSRGSRRECLVRQCCFERRSSRR